MLIFSCNALVLSILYFFCVFLCVHGFVSFRFLLAKIGDEGTVVNDKKQAHAPAFL